MTPAETIFKSGCWPGEKASTYNIGDKDLQMVYQWLFIWLVYDIEESGYICDNIPFEVGSRDHISISNRSNLATIHGMETPKMKLKTCMQTISKISLLCSY